MHYNNIGTEINCSLLHSMSNPVLPKVRPATGCVFEALFLSIKAGHFFIGKLFSSYFFTLRFLNA